MNTTITTMMMKIKMAALHHQGEQKSSFLFFPTRVLNFKPTDFNFLDLINGLFPFYSEFFTLLLRPVLVLKTPEEMRVKTHQTLDVVWFPDASHFDARAPPAGVVCIRTYIGSLGHRQQQQPWPKNNNNKMALVLLVGLPDPTTFVRLVLSC